jgi:EAL domain-containing protein (putative c-di-GMP-specific phosphodiesterase class I)
MGQALGIDVVAECVETHEQADQLRAMGCTTAQGWLYAKAQTAVDAGRILGTRLAEPAIGGELGAAGN